MTDPTKETSAFLRALTEMLNGARHAQDMAEVLVTEAVQQTLARVVQDYPLDYSQLVARYQADIVHACCHLVDDAPHTCSATTKAGKPCGRKSVMSGFCAQHLEAWKDQQAARRRTEAYAATLRRENAEDVHSQELQQLSKKRNVSMSNITSLSGVL